jgi:hypothetical protein
MFSQEARRSRGRVKTMNYLWGSESHNVANEYVTDHPLLCVVVPTTIPFGTIKQLSSPHPPSEYRNFRQAKTPANAPLLFDTSPMIFF